VPTGDCSRIVNKIAGSALSCFRDHRAHIKGDKMKLNLTFGLTRTALYAILALVSALIPTAQGAELRVHNYFTDNMVLQRDKPVAIRGFVDKGAVVTVTFAGRKKSTRADKQGAWSITLDPMSANSKPQTLSVTSTIGNLSSQLKNILVGDVLFFMRQTSVDISLGRSKAGRKAAVNHKPTGLLRTRVITTVPAKEPLHELNSGAASGWTQVDGKSALTMSGAAYYLGCDLAQKLSIPVGIVDLNMGSHFAVGWLSSKALDDSLLIYPENKDMKTLPKRMMDDAAARDSGEAQKELDEWYQKSAESVMNRWKYKPLKPSLGLHPLENPIYPSAGYNAIIHPLKGIACKAILLQLGNDYPFVAYSAIASAGKGQNRAELNSAWGEDYNVLKVGFRITPFTLPMIPREWRTAFGDDTLPIGLIMPPGSDLYTYAQHAREVRELERRMCETIPELGLIMPGNKHIPLSGQPSDDQLLAERCSSWVQGAVLDKKGVAPTGPSFERVEARLSQATLFFKNGTADGLKATGNALANFEVSGSDGEFSAAIARIEGSVVKLKSDKVNNIQYIRYNWQGKPDQRLVNSSGLPALPFTTQADWKFAWIVPNAPPDLPSEYHTPASEWGGGNVAIINGSLNPKGGDSVPIPSWIGPLGIFSAPFGPNIYVIRIEAGSPADGKVLPGDLIYSANGNKFGSNMYPELAGAITHSESDAGGGKLAFGVRRNGKNIDVELQLEVMGAFSSTSPYHCPKSERIIEKAEEYLVKRFRPTEGAASNKGGFLHTDMLFLLAAGTPEHQGLVRRMVYEMIADYKIVKPDPHKQGVSNWKLGYAALLLGEYYQATGDRNVLPYMQNMQEWMVMTQIKPPTIPASPWEWAPTSEQVGGWRQKYHAVYTGSTYGLMPHAGMACVMSMVLAREAGIEIDKLAYKRGLTHFDKGRAEYGIVIYGYGGLLRSAPKPVDPDKEETGELTSDNGKLGAAAALFKMAGNERTAAVCSRICTYSFNNTRSGHGGMFFNNFWTPIGANVAGENGYKHFMKGQNWWRELYRRHDGSFTQDGRGGIGVAYALHYAAPRKRLRILGAPESAFSPNAPVYLAPALEAHKNRDYALCEKLVLKEIKERIIAAEELPYVEKLLQSVCDLQQSINHDLTYTENLIKAGKYYYAMLELPQLRGVVAEDDSRLKAIAQRLESPKIAAEVSKISNDLRNEKRQKDKERKQAASITGTKELWDCIVTEVPVDRDRTALGKVPEQEATKWRMKVVESLSQAPEGWTKVDFDDKLWNETTLPISWRLYHTVLYRAKFNIKNKAEFDALRIRGLFFQQLNVQVHINGVNVAKIDNIGRGTSLITAPLTDLAMEVLKNGENTISVSTRHNRRWGPGRGKYTTVNNSGFGFRLDARRSE